MNDVPLELLFGILIVLLVISAFFSSSETAMMSLNRYRLKHLCNKGNTSALRVEKLLLRPDRLIGLILIGNNLVNIFAASLSTIIAIRLLGDSGIVVGGILLTLVMLIFSEVTPKTIATLYPQKIAFFSSRILKPLSYVFFPAVLLINGISNGLTKLFGINKAHGTNEQLSSDELRTVVNEAGSLIPKQHQDMLLNILDLEKSTVEDIMIPRSEVEGLDIDDPVLTLLEQIRTSAYTRLPVFEKDINNVIGVLHLRRAAAFLRGDDSQVTIEHIKAEMHEPYFVPESTRLNTQLIYFKKQKHRIAIVVNEYGDVQGIITLEDLLEEIVGEFTSNTAEIEEEDIISEENGWQLINGGTFMRDINRTLKWNLPTGGPKTLNGLTIEYLEDIPDANVAFVSNGYMFETVEITHKMISWIRVKQYEHVSNENHKSGHL